MGMPTTRTELIGYLESVRVVEVKARLNYVEDLALFHDPRLEGPIERIKRDEDEHILILSALLATLKKEA